jgi:hypothetical protein
LAEGQAENHNHQEAEPSFLPANDALVARTEPADGSDPRPAICFSTHRWAARWRRCVTVAKGHA